MNRLRTLLVEEVAREMKFLKFFISFKNILNEGKCEELFVIVDSIKSAVTKFLFYNLNQISQLE
jgi:hypothetical protein